jgi:hypothetical protein
VRAANFHRTFAFPSRVLQAELRWGMIELNWVAVACILAWLLFMRAASAISVGPASLWLPRICYGQSIVSVENNSSRSGPPQAACLFFHGPLPVVYRKGASFFSAE